MNRGQSSTQSVTHCSSFHPPPPFLFVASCSLWMKRMLSCASDQLWVSWECGYSSAQGLCVALITCTCVNLHWSNSHWCACVTGKDKRGPPSDPQRIPLPHRRAEQQVGAMTLFSWPCYDLGVSPMEEHYHLCQVSALLIHSLPSDLCWCWPVTSPNSLTGP